VYARLPWLAGPLFLAEAPWRLRAETAAAFPARATRRRFARSQLATLLKTRLSLRRMAARALMISSAGGGVVRGAHVACPTLVITGEHTLDHVVPGASTSEYLRLIPGARGVVLERTGHLGSITKPDLFARVIRDFVNGRHYAAA
jgi:pimeloyl-ACP methyl ester carboxylesterase